MRYARRCEVAVSALVADPFFGSVETTLTPVCKIIDGPPAPAFPDRTGTGPDGSSSKPCGVRPGFAAA